MNEIVLKHVRSLSICFKLVYFLVCSLRPGVGSARRATLAAAALTVIIFFFKKANKTINVTPKSTILVCNMYFFSFTATRNVLSIFRTRFEVDFGEI